MKVDRIAAALLLTLGALTLGTGSYFVFLRPAMLPEDVRITGMTPEQLSPAMLDWLRLVFQTWGAFVAAFGILLVAVAAHLMTSRQGVLHWGLALGVLVAFGRFLASNIILGSDYLWFIAVLFAFAVLTALCFVWHWVGLSRRNGS